MKISYVIMFLGIGLLVEKRENVIFNAIDKKKTFPLFLNGRFSA